MECVDLFTSWLCVAEQQVHIWTEKSIWWGAGTGGWRTWSHGQSFPTQCLQVYFRGQFCGKTNQSEIKKNHRSRESKKKNNQYPILYSNIEVLTCLSVEQSELGVVRPEDAAAHDLQLVHSESVVSFGVLQQNHTLWSGKQGKKYYRYYIILVVVILTCPSHMKPSKRSVWSIYLSGLGY